jgi:hypothetical protein
MPLQEEKHEEKELKCKCKSFARENIHHNINNLNKEQFHLQYRQNGESDLPFFRSYSTLTLRTTQCSFTLDSVLSPAGVNSQQTSMLLSKILLG